MTQHTEKLEVKIEKKAEEVKSVPVRTRPEREFGLTAGPLSFLNDLKIPGFHTRLINETLGSNKFRLTDVQKPAIGYEFIHPTEVGLDVNNTAISDGQKVRYILKSGQCAYLMKRPIEWEIEDQKAKQKRNVGGLKAKVADKAAVSLDNNITDAGVILR